LKRTLECIELYVFMEWWYSVRSCNGAK